MKTDLARPAARYRNDAIFRSAQRLIASAPPKKAREKSPRWLIFTVGIVAGIGLTIAGLMCWSSLRPRSAVGKAFTDLVARISAPAQITGRSAVASPVATSAGPNVTPGKTTDASLDRPASPDAQENPRDRVYRAATLASLTAGPTPATTDERQATSYLAAGVTHYVTVANLRGELRAENADPVGIEFALRRLAEGDSSKLLGVVRFLNGNVRVAANTVSGEIRDRTMTLQETAPIWILDRTPPPFGRTFVIQLPEDATAAEITGTWSFGAQRGTLALKFAAPW